MGRRRAAERVPVRFARRPGLRHLGERAAAIDAPCRQRRTGVHRPRCCRRLPGRDQLEPHGISAVQQIDRLRALVAAELVDHPEQHGVLPGHHVNHRLAKFLQHRADRRRELRWQRQVLRRANQRAEQAFPEPSQLIHPVGPVDVVDHHAHLEELAGADQEHDLIPWRQRTEARVGAVP